MIDIVIPSLGRPSLQRLLASLARSAGPAPNRVIVVDDRADSTVPLDLRGCGNAFADRLMIVRGSARGPAAARNRGWRRSTADWIAFLDDDVEVGETWLADLTADLAKCSARTAASQGRLTVPLPIDRRPTDWERNVAGLEDARWITADCAYRRADLIAAGGFDERFPRAFREDADLALRVVARGRTIVRGNRRSIHPVRPAPSLISIALQAGNADDVLMDALHGSDWYERAGASRGTFRRHVWTVGFAVTAMLGAVAWTAATLTFAWRRIAPGPRTRAEIGAMLVSSAVLPFAAVRHRIAGYLTLPAKIASGARPSRVPAAVLFDRDGTLVEDVPHNGEPAAVAPMDGARVALERLRAAGIAIGIVSNQSGIGLGRISAEQVGAVNARVVELLGPIGTIKVCPHLPGGGCACRKPAPGLIVDAARALGLRTSDCVVVGDIGSDIDAARAAGAASILIPTPITRPEEIAAADVVARDLLEAVDVILGSRA